jgi:ADP-ribose pyrophosphatase YjhB (NUDIX family)
LHGLYYYTDDPRGPGILIVYRATCPLDADPVAGDDADDVAFFPADALPPISHHTHQAALTDWAQQRSTM